MIKVVVIEDDEDMKEMLQIWAEQDAELEWHYPEVQTMDDAYNVDYSIYDVAVFDYYMKDGPCLDAILKAQDQGVPIVILWTGAFKIDKKLKGIPVVQKTGILTLRAEVMWAVNHHR